MKISYTKTFKNDLLRVPLEVRPKVPEGVKKLKDSYPNEKPEIAEATAIKNIFLLQIYSAGDWLLVYDDSDFPITIGLIMVGKRPEILERLRLEDPKKPNDFLKGAHPELLINQPTDEERTEASIHGIPPADKSPNTKYEITDQHLKQCGFPKNSWGKLRGRRTWSEILQLPQRITSNEVTSDKCKDLLQLLRPAPIEEVGGQPKFVLKRIDDLNAPQRLQDWMLKLDPDQEKIINFFKESEDEDPVGPWEVTGGPGSGKTVLALHAIHSILTNPYGLEYKILFTSYTNTIVDLADKLLDKMLNPSVRSCVTCKSIYSVAREYTDVKQTGTEFTEKIKDVIENRNFLSLQGYEELVESEITWQIIDKSIATPDDYSPILVSSEEKGMIWEIYKVLKKDELHCWHEIISSAAARAPANGIYDFVFFDEVQDIQISGVQLAKKLSKSGKNVFFSGDENQSIFAPRQSLFGVVIKKILGFVGRAVGILTGRSWVLSTNHRSTKQIIDAIKDVAEQLNIVQLSSNWLGEHTTEGPRPVIAKCNNENDVYRIIREFINERTIENKLGLPSAYILCNRGQHPSPRDVALQLSDLNAEHFSSRQFHQSWDHQGIKTTWIQSCKGLDLPVTIIIGLTKDNWEYLFDKSDDRLAKYKREHAERVLLTALSRTTTDLLITTLKDEQPDFIDKLSPEIWNVIDC